MESIDHIEVSRREGPMDETSKLVTYTLLGRHDQPEIKTWMSVILKSSPDAKEAFIKLGIMRKICAAVKHTFGSGSRDGENLWHWFVDELHSSGRTFQTAGPDDLKKYYESQDIIADHSIQTVKYLAYKTNPKQLTNELAYRIALGASESFDADEELYSFCMHEFFSHIIFTSVKSKRWYVLDITECRPTCLKVSEMSDNTVVMNLIQKKMIPYIEHLLKHLGTDPYLLGESNAVGLKRLQATLKNIRSRGVYSTLKYAFTKFTSDLIDRFLDVRENVFPLKNGVVDIINDEENDTHDVQFRLALPEDFYTKCCPTSYPTEDVREKIDELQHYLRQILHTDEMIDYTMTLLASCIRGNKYKSFIIITGDSNAGKSGFKNLLEKTVGEEFCSTMDSEQIMVNGSRVKAGAANSDLAKSVGCRWLCTQETDDRLQTFSAGKIKELTGGDSLSVRGLWEQSRVTKLLGTLMLFCNAPPQFSQVDSAIMNRLIIIPFESTFSDSAPADPEEQRMKRSYPINAEFDTKLDKMTEAFIYLLLKYLGRVMKNYRRMRPPMPKRVTNAIKQYMVETDTYAEYINKYLEKDEQFSMNVDDVILQYGIWMRQFDSTFKMNRRTAIHDMGRGLVRLGYQVHDDKVVGCRLRRQEQ